MVGTFQNPLRQEHGGRDKPPKMASSKSSNYGGTIVRIVFITCTIAYIPSLRLIGAVGSEKFAEYEPVVSPNYWSTIVWSATREVLVSCIPLARIPSVYLPAEMADGTAQVSRRPFD